MMDLFSSVSLLSVVAAFVPYFMLGGLWFTVFFKKPYSISLGKENNMPEKPAPIFIVGPALCTLVITIASALLMSALPIDSYGSAIALAALVGIGYLVANTMNIAINPNIPKPIMYGIISSAYHMIGILIVFVILFAFK